MTDPTNCISMQVHRDKEFGCDSVFFSFFLFNSASFEVRLKGTRPVEEQCFSVIPLIEHGEEKKNHVPLKLINKMVKM